MNDAIRDGAVAGIVGGGVSGVWALVASPLLGTDPWLEARLAAVPLLGRAALEPGLEIQAVVTGAASHMVVSIAWGIVFAIAFQGYGRAATLAAGVGFGLVVWLAMFNAVLPALGVAWIVDGFSVGRAVTEHVIFGLGVALGYVILRWDRSRWRVAGALR